VVYDDSAIIGDARENCDYIHADHSGMSKFSSRDDYDYKKVLYAIEVILGRLSQSESGSANAG
jgi:hypothetical protein